MNDTVEVAPRADSTFWLNSYVDVQPSGDRVIDIQRAIALAAEIDSGAGLPEAAMELVLYAQSQVEFLKQFHCFDRWYKWHTLSVPDIVSLRLGAAADVVELLKLARMVHDKAPDTRLDREAAAALGYASQHLQFLDTVLVKVNAPLGEH
jgi:hypothetical protein